MKIIKSIIIVVILLSINYLPVYADDPTPTTTPTKTPGFTQTPIGTYVPTATSIYSENPEIAGCPIFTPGAETDLSWYYECSDCLRDPTATSTITPEGFLTPTPTVTPGNNYWVKWININETFGGASGNWTRYDSQKHYAPQIANNIIKGYIIEGASLTNRTYKFYTGLYNADVSDMMAYSGTTTSGNFYAGYSLCYDKAGIGEGIACQSVGHTRTGSMANYSDSKYGYGLAITESSGSMYMRWDRFGVIYYGMGEIATSTPTITPECIKPVLSVGESYQTYGMNEVIYKDGVFWEQYGNDVENVWADININSEKVTEIKFISGTNDFLPVYLETEIQLYDKSGNLISQCRRESGCTNGLTITSDLFNEYTKINSASEISVDKIRIILNNFSYVHIDYIDVTGCQESENSKCMYPEESTLDPILNFSGISYAETKCTLLLPESLEFDKVNDLLPAGWEPIDDLFLIANGITVCFDLVNLPTVTILGFTISVTFVLNVLYVVMIWQWFMAMFGVK